MPDGLLPRVYHSTVKTRKGRNVIPTWKYADASKDLTGNNTSSAKRDDNSDPQVTDPECRQLQWSVGSAEGGARRPPVLQGASSHSTGSCSSMSSRVHCGVVDNRTDQATSSGTIAPSAGSIASACQAGDADEDMEDAADTLLEMLNVGCSPKQPSSCDEASLVMRGPATDGSATAVPVLSRRKPPTARQRRGGKRWGRPHSPPALVEMETAARATPARRRRGGLAVAIEAGGSTGARSSKAEGVGSGNGSKVGGHTCSLCGSTSTVQWRHPSDHFLKLSRELPGLGAGSNALPGDWWCNRCWCKQYSNLRLAKLAKEKEQHDRDAAPEPPPRPTPASAPPSQAAAARAPTAAAGPDRSGVGSSRGQRSAAVAVPKAKLRASVDGEGRGSAAAQPAAGPGAFAPLAGMSPPQLMPAGGLGSPLLASWMALQQARVVQQAHMYSEGMVVGREVAAAVAAAAASASAPTAAAAARNAPPLVVGMPVSGILPCPHFPVQGESHDVREWVQGGGALLHPALTAPPPPLGVLASVMAMDTSPP